MRGFALALLLVLTAGPSVASAHRLDEYLQATIVAIEPGEIRLRMNLTPGVAVARAVIFLIDTNRDGTISPDEASAYANSLKRDLTLRLDGRELALTPAASDFPEPAEVREGSGIIQVEFSAMPGTLSGGSHRLTLDNRHLGAISVYLINAAIPKSAGVKIRRQIRNENQSTGEIEFTVGASLWHRASIAGSAVVLIVLAAAACTRKRRARGSFVEAGYTTSKTLSGR